MPIESARRGVLMGGTVTLLLIRTSGTSGTGRKPKSTDSTISVKPDESDSAGDGSRGEGFPIGPDAIGAEMLRRRSGRSGRAALRTLSASFLPVDADRGRGSGCGEGGQSGSSSANRTLPTGRTLLGPRRAEGGSAKVSDALRVRVIGRARRWFRVLRLSVLSAPLLKLRCRRALLLADASASLGVDEFDGVVFSHSPSVPDEVVDSAGRVCVRLKRDAARFSGLKISLIVLYSSQ